MLYLLLAKPRGAQVFRCCNSVAATSLRVLTPALAHSLKHGTSCHVHACRTVKLFARLGLGAAAAVDHLLGFPSYVLVAGITFLGCRQ